MNFNSLPEAQKNLRPYQFRKIIDGAVEAAKKLKKQEAILIKALQEVDRSRAYRFIGYNSLYQFSMKVLKLSEAQSYNYITVARKVVKIPKLQEAIDNGELTVGKARKISSVITENNQTEWLEFAKQNTQKNIEKKVAQVNPKERVPERTRYLNDTLLEMQLSIDEESYKLLEKVRTLLVTKRKGAISLSDCIEEMANTYLDKNDPERKAERRLKKTMIKQERKKVQVEHKAIIDITETISNKKSLKINAQETVSDEYISQNETKPVARTVRRESSCQSKT